MTNSASTSARRESACPPPWRRPPGPRRRRAVGRVPAPLWRQRREIGNHVAGLEAVGRQVPVDRSSSRRSPDRRASAPPGCGRHAGRPWAAISGRACARTRARAGWECSPCRAPRAFLPRAEVVDAGGTGVVPVCAEQDGCVCAQRLHQLGIVELVKVNRVRSTREDLSESPARRGIRVQKFAAVRHSHPGSGRIGLDLCGEHRHRDPPSGKCSSARLHVRRHAAVPAPQRCHHQHRARSVGDGGGGALSCGVTDYHGKR